MLRTLRCNDVNVIVCVFVVLFGMGSWIAINGMWVELPILVDNLPEGWNLPSYLTVIIQIANIGPIAYTVGHIRFPGVVKEKPVVYIMVVIGTAASLLMAFFWQETSVVAGANHSTALLTLMFFMSLVDCTSSVVFLPFMNIFSHHYMIAYFIGEGFSGLVPSLVALGQGVGEVKCVNTSYINKTTNETEYHIQSQYLPPKFPVEDFFFFLFAMMILCGISFIVLNHLPYCQREHTNNRYEVDQQYLSDNIPSNNQDNAIDANVASSSDKCLGNQKTYGTSEVGESHVEQVKTERVMYSQNSKANLSTLRYAYFLVLIAWINLLTNGVLPSVQSYACLPYGTQAFHFAVTFSSIANPSACFIAFFLPARSPTVIGMVTLVGSAISSYILLLSAYSPDSLLTSTEFGAVLAVSAYVLVYLLLTYAKVTIATLFRLEGGKALLFCGAVTQAGSAVGAAVIFVIVNVYKLFQQKYPCT